MILSYWHNVCYVVSYHWTGLLLVSPTSTVHEWSETTSCFHLLCNRSILTSGSPLFWEWMWPQRGKLCCHTSSHDHHMPITWPSHDHHMTITWPSQVRHGMPNMSPDCHMTEKPELWLCITSRLIFFYWRCDSLIFHTYKYVFIYRTEYLV